MGEGVEGESKSLRAQRRRETLACGSYTSWEDRGCMDDLYYSILE
jgi:hypothetical protein